MAARAVRRGCAAAARRWRALLAAGAALAALCARVPAHHSAQHALPSRAPASLAHALADFSNQPDVESWWVEEDGSNYTTWRYAVRYTCGARCSGHALVVAHDAPRAAPQHGHAAREHRVWLARRACSAAPLLAWPQLCEELEVDTVVTGLAGGGAQLQEQWRTRCGVLAWLSGACARGLRAHSQRRLQRLSVPPARP